MQPASNCNICGSSDFGPGPNGRMSATGYLPRCQECWSLERHRAARLIFSAIPPDFLKERRAIQFAPDGALEREWFSTYEKSSYGGENSIDLQDIPRMNGMYDFISLSHVLEFVPDDKRAFSELFRIGSRRAIIHIVWASMKMPKETTDFDPPKPPFGRHHDFGTDIAERYRFGERGISEVVVSATDPVTGVVERASFYCRAEDDARLLASHFHLLGDLSVVIRSAEPAQTFQVPRVAGFPSHEFALPIDWSVNPPGNVLWGHAFMTLRWVVGLDDEALALVLSDFISYHRTLGAKRSPYYDGPDADHAAAERLSILAQILARKQAFPPELDSALRDEIRRHVDLLASEAIYRPKTNHGLQVDLAVLGAAVVHPEMVNPEQRRLCDQRAVAQLDWLFAQDGMTREHSITYQEYNLNICVQVVERLGALEGCVALERARSILQHGAPALAWALRADGSYSALGDSFHRPIPLRIEAICSHVVDRAVVAVLQGRGTPQEGLAIYPDAGFAFIRAGVAHVGLTCSRHSGVHKQNDDTAFTFFRDRPIIEDPGYSDVLVDSAEWRKVTRAAASHSLLLIPGRDWQAGQSRIFAEHRSASAFGVAAEHYCYGIVVRRYLWLMNGTTLIVFDVAGEAVDYEQQFVLAPGLVPDVGDVLKLPDAGVAISHNAAEVRIGEVHYFNDRSAEQTVAIRLCGKGREAWASIGPKSVGAVVRDGECGFLVDGQRVEFSPLAR